VKVPHFGSYEETEKGLGKRTHRHRDASCISEFLESDDLHKKLPENWGEIHVRRGGGLTWACAGTVKNDGESDEW